jgi:outer membrane protein assembly factor BamD
LRIAGRIAGRALRVVALCALAAACGSRGANDPILRLSAAEALAEGKRLLERERFAAARPYFSHAFEVEPNSAAGREALLLVAETLFLEGGDANLIQAEAKYRDFQNRFPTSDRAAYVQYKIAASLAGRMERPDRDQESTEKARVALEDLLRLYPTSEFAEEARAELERVRTNLAEHEYLVGRFYLRYGLPLAAAARFEGLLDTFPDYGQRDKALFNLALAQRAAKRADDAAATAAKLRAEHPQSKYLEKLPESKP